MSLQRCSSPSREGKRLLELSEPTHAQRTSDRTQHTVPTALALKSAKGSDAMACSLCGRWAPSHGEVSRAQARSCLQLLQQHGRAWNVQVAATSCHSLPQAPHHALKNMPRVNSLMLLL